MKYYVYAYFDPDTCKPIYIGKGHGLRCIQHFNDRHLALLDMFHRHLKKMILAGKIPIVRIIHNNLEESVSYELEILYIKKYGRRVDGSGILLNMIEDSREYKRKRFPCRRFS